MERQGRRRGWGLACVLALVSLAAQPACTGGAVRGGALAELPFSSHASARTLLEERLLLNSSLPDGTADSAKPSRRTASDDGPSRHIECEAGLQPTPQSQCEFARTSPGCHTDSKLNYVTFYFCTWSWFRSGAFALLTIWLAALFFMLGNTAADYFCPALEELSTILHLPPTVAGVTLLPLGNGAPDVFASIASFMGAQQGEVGLNSVLGAASFVVCVVGGSVAVAVARRSGHFKMDKASFLRDLTFFLFSIFALLVVNLIGYINLFGAIAFFAIYIAYGVSVAYFEMQRTAAAAAAAAAAAPGSPLLPGQRGASVQLQPIVSGGFSQASSIALLPSAAEAADTLTAHNLPQWMWIRKLKPFQAQLAHPHNPRMRSFRNQIDSSRASTLGRAVLPSEVEHKSFSYPRFSSHREEDADSDSFTLMEDGPGVSVAAAAAAAVAAAEAAAQGGASPSQGRGFRQEYEEEEDGSEIDDYEKLMWGWEDEEEEPLLWYTPNGFVEYFIKLPLTLPRMLTIPVHSKESWSRLWFVTSITLAPAFAVFATLEGQASWHLWGVSAAVGAVLGLVALYTSTEDSPPRSFVMFWVTCGFAMSMIWFYVIANELVSLLVTFGDILEIDTAVLGLTVLAWGNSIGDFMANLALVQGGGAARVQIAWSGCFAGPLFNILVGLGMSMVLSTWGTFPRAFVMPSDPALPWLLAFLAGVLVFAMVRLPASDMKLDRVLGVTLIASYCTFMGLRILQLFGINPFALL